MRRSPRRRVMPRASSSLTSGRACLRVTPAASRNSLTVNPSGRSASSRAASSAAAVDRVGVEPHAVALDEQPAADELAELGPVDAVGRRRRHPAGGERGETGGRRAGRRRRPVRARPPSTTTSSSVAEHRPLALVERADVQPERAGVGEPLRAATRSSPCSASSDGDPAADRRLAALAGEALELVDVDPAPLGDDPLDACGRAGPATPAAPGRRRAPRRRRPSRRARSRAARSGRRAAAAAAIGQVQPDRPGRARRQRVGAEHAQPHRMLARADVGEVGAPPRHVVVERGEHRRARRRSARSATTARRRRRRRRGRRRRGRRRRGSARPGCPARCASTASPRVWIGADPGRQARRARRRPDRRSRATRRSACR